MCFQVAASCIGSGVNYGRDRYELVSGRSSEALCHLPALSHLDQKHAGSFTSAPHHREQAVYTWLPSAPEPASWAGTGTESLKTLCTRHCDKHCLCLLLGVDEDALGLCTPTSHPFPEMTGYLCCGEPRDSGIHPGVLSLFFFSSRHKNPSSVPVLHLPGSLAAGCPVNNVLLRAQDNQGSFPLPV